MVNYWGGGRSMLLHCLTRHHMGGLSGQVCGRNGKKGVFSPQKSINVKSYYSLFDNVI